MWPSKSRRSRSSATLQESTISKTYGSQNTAQASQFKNGGHLDPRFYSSKGAFNGSGLAATCQTFPGHVEESVVLYYQHHSGTIRWKYMQDDNWLGGGNTEIVAYDAKNGTPISAVAYENNETSTV